MKKLCMVTYTRTGEGYTDELKKISDGFYELLGNDFKVVICCETIFQVAEFPYDVQVWEIAGTKYRRLIKLMEKDDSSYYFSVDNDITGNIEQMKKFVMEMIDGDYDIGWGRIRAKSPKGLVSNMVAVDKLLSHNIIRPVLWKMGVGISVPGQIFCIKADTYRNNLIDLDTFLDDVALGLYANVNDNKRYCVNYVLGEEIPNSSFEGLWKQRGRWAVGYASILKGVKSNKQYKKLVMIHGFSYHFLWMINWLIVLLLALVSWKIALAYVIINSVAVVYKDVSYAIYSLLYMFLFPIFHIRWMEIMFKELSKKED